MNLNALQHVDRKTAEGILAVAALSTAPNSGMDEPTDFFGRYSKQAGDVLSEIRSRLKISPTDNSDPARVAIDNVLSNALQRLILDPANTSSALGRAGQSGRLSPVLYEVVQSPQFTNLFYGLGVTSSHVVDAIKHPDDHQHLMAEGIPEEWKTLSLFMKWIAARNARNRHWLLVQTNRIGLQQHAQAAWKLYPSDVDLSEASTPLDAMKAFANSFGNPISVESKKAFFVDPQNFPFDTQVKIEWTGALEDTFVAFSQTVRGDTRLFKIGLAYCIDLRRYRAALKAHGVRVHQPGARRWADRASIG